MPRNELRIDAVEKVTGRAVYTDDFRLSNMLHIKEVHCPYPHARIENIDISEAESMPGVVLILTAKDMPENPNPLDKPIIAGPEVLCADEAVAIVAAESEKQAAAAAKAVKVEYTQLPAVLCIDDAIAPDAEKVHPDGNVVCTCILEKGSADDFSGCKYVIEHEFRTQRIHHGAVEPDCVAAYPEGDGVCILGGSKGPFNVQKEVSELLHIPAEKVHFRHLTIGGGFGGKLCDTVSLGARTAMVALKTGRPCKLLWTREETLTEGTKRHPFQIKVKLGADADGKIISSSVTGYADAGAYLAHSKGVVFRAMAECTGPYKVENAYVNLKGVFTNTVSSDAVRGFGSPQVGFAMECAIDMLAEKVGISPFELRMKNVLHDGDIMASGQTAERVSIGECGTELAKRFDMTRPRAWRSGSKAYGWGLAFMVRGESHGALSNGNDICGIDLDVIGEDKIMLSTSISEVGQGAYTAEAMLLAELLGISRDCISVRGADTACTPRCTTTSGSRGTISGANGVWLAYLDMVEKLKSVVAGKYAIDESAIHYLNAKFYMDSGREAVSLWEALDLYKETGRQLHFEGRWKGPYTGWDWDAHTGVPYYSYGYGTAAALVEVDLISGRVKIEDLAVINDLGHIINHEEAKAQLAGGLMMSVGFALTEETAMSKGVISSRNFDKYIMPMANDIVNIRPMPEELVPAANPMGIHGVGELSASIAAPAIANAVANAVGKRIYELPLTLERVRAAIDESREERK